MIDHQQLTCQELVELVTDYFEDALGPAERARLEAHVAGCPGCHVYLRQMRTAVALVGETAALATRPEVSALLDAFRDWNRARHVEHTERETAAGHPTPLHDTRD
jgi:anti-sigma factor RsiW